MTGFHDVGYAALVVLGALFLAGAVTAAGGAGRALVFPGALALADGLRGRCRSAASPDGLPLSQAHSRWSPSVRLCGQLVLTGLVAAGADLRWDWPVEGGAVVLVVMVGLWSADGWLGGATLPAPPARRGGAGGGPRGVRQTDPQAVRPPPRSQLLPSGPVDLVLWPEDVVDVDLPIEDTDEAAEIGAEAQRLQATLVAGVVEDNGEDRFRTRRWCGVRTDGSVGRYDKVHRVPFGEYVPFRGLIDHLADLSAIPRDAVPGHGSGMVRTPAAPVGLMVSYEVFFPDRARAAVRAGAQVLLVPTNASSFGTGQVPAQELAAARLRALETGRWVVQAAPTGYAIIGPDGRSCSAPAWGRGPSSGGRCPAEPAAPPMSCGAISQCCWRPSGSSPPAGSGSA